MKDLLDNSPSSSPKTSFIRPLIFLLMLGSIIAAVRILHLQEYLEESRLRQFVASFGVWGPVIYLALWTVLPLVIPGLPMTLAGGVLFGPYWGVVFVLVGATLGAIPPFLVARYLAREWVEAKMSGTWLMDPDVRVSRRGWLVVAAIRMVTVFSYFIYNYAFGLTRLSMGTYTLATCIFMLPITVVCVFFPAFSCSCFTGWFPGRCS